MAQVLRTRPRRYAVVKIREDAVGQQAQRQVGRTVAHHRVLENLDSQRVEEDNRVHRLQGTACQAPTSAVSLLRFIERGRAQAQPVVKGAS